MGALASTAVALGIAGTGTTAARTAMQDGNGAPSQVMVFSYDYSPGLPFEVVNRLQQQTVDSVLGQTVGENGDQLVNDPTEYNGYVVQYQSGDGTIGEYTMVFVRDETLTGDTTYEFTPGDVTFFNTDVTLLQAGLQRTEGEESETDDEETTEEDETPTEDQETTEEGDETPTDDGETTQEADETPTETTPDETTPDETTEQVVVEPTPPGDGGDGYPSARHAAGSVGTTRRKTHERFRGGVGSRPRRRCPSSDRSAAVARNRPSHLSLVRPPETGPTVTRVPNILYV